MTVLRVNPIRHLIATIAIVGLPIVVRAQGVPLLSFDLTSGGGRSTMGTAHADYGFETPTLLRAAATFRLGTSGRIRPVVVAEYSESCPIVGCGTKAICYISPKGCLQALPNPDGSAIAAGVAGSFGRLLVMQATAGVGDYWGRASYLDLTVAISPLSHLAFIAGIREITGRDGHGDNIWFLPRSFGIRIH